MSNFAAIITMVATIVIAYATWQMWRVYQCMAEQIAKQIGQTRELIDLTRALFLESNKPMLSVSIEECRYSESTEKFEMQIVVANHGTTVANRIRLLVQFGGTNFRKEIGPLTVQPQRKLRQPFSYPMTPDAYKAGQADGNRLNALVEGSYWGLAKRSTRTPVNVTNTT
jgi:hypothetical protein